MSEDLDLLLQLTGSILCDPCADIRLVELAGGSSGGSFGVSLPFFSCQHICHGAVQLEDQRASFARVL
jgi:hypothetical protein